MATYQEIYLAATTDSPLLHQTAVAIKKAAYDITNEAANTPNHTERLQWSRNVHLTDRAPVVWAQKMVWRVLDNATVAAAVGIDVQTGASTSTALDSDVQFVVNSLVDEFAVG